MIYTLGLEIRLGGVKCEFGPVDSLLHILRSFFLLSVDSPESYWLSPMNTTITDWQCLTLSFCLLALLRIFFLLSCIFLAKSLPLSFHNCIQFFITPRLGADDSYITYSMCCTCTLKSEYSFLVSVSARIL